MLLLFGCGKSPEEQRKAKIKEEMDIALASPDHPIRKHVENAHIGAETKAAYVEDVEIYRQVGRKDIIKVKIALKWRDLIQENGHDNVEVISVDGGKTYSDPKITDSTAPYTKKKGFSLINFTKAFFSRFSDFFK